MKRFLAGSATPLAVVASQLSNSAANFVFQLLLASMLSASAFGTVVMGLSVYYLSLAVVRAAGGDVLTAAGPAMWRRSATLTIGVGVVASLVLVAAALFVEEQGLILVVLAVALPILLLHDLARYSLWASGKAGLVVAMDLTRFIALLPGAILSLALDQPVLLVLAWIGGSLAGMLLWITARSESARPATAVHNATARRLGFGFLGDQLPPAAVAHALPIVLAVIAGPALAGTYRVMFLPFMVAETILLATRVTRLANFARSGGDTRSQLVKAAGAYGIVTLVGMVPTSLLLLAPVRDLLGEAAELVGLGFIGAGIVVLVRAVGRPFADAVAIAHGVRATASIRGGAAVLEVSLVAGAAVLWGLWGLLAARIAVGMVLTTAYAAFALRFDRPSVAPDATSGESNGTLRQLDELAPGSFQ